MDKEEYFEDDVKIEMKDELNYDTKVEVKRESGEYFEEEVKN